MTTLQESAQQALEALCLPCPRWNGTQSKIVNDAITALRAALAEPVQELVARVRVNSNVPGRINELDLLRPLPRGEHFLYTAPPQRKPLTEEEISEIASRLEQQGNTMRQFARAIEEAVWKKNS